MMALRFLGKQQRDDKPEFRNETGGICKQYIAAAREHVSRFGNKL